MKLIFLFASLVMAYVSFLNDKNYVDSKTEEATSFRPRGLRRHGIVVLVCLILSGVAGWMIEIENAESDALSAKLKSAHLRLALLRESESDYRRLTALTNQTFGNLATYLQAVGEMASIQEKKPTESQVANVLQRTFASRAFDIPGVVEKLKGEREQLRVLLLNQGLPTTLMLDDQFAASTERILRIIESIRGRKENSMTLAEIKKSHTQIAKDRKDAMNSMNREIDSIIANIQEEIMDLVSSGAAE